MLGAAAVLAGAVAWASTRGALTHMDAATAPVAPVPPPEAP